MKAGIFRIVILNLLCFCMIFYSGFLFLKPSSSGVKTIPANNKVPVSDKNVSSAGSSSNQSKTESSQSSAPAKENNQSSNPIAESSQSSAVAVSAGAVKGKIITRYITPYTAPLSYDKIYMKNSTDLKISIKNLLNGKINFKIKKNSDPQVLILHTHATECFMLHDKDYYTENDQPRTTDNTKNMVAIGKVVAAKLNAAGIKTIHDTTQHDYPKYTESYSRAAKTINSYLKKYPSIKVVLDLHRDAVSSGESDKVKLVTEINGKKAAQVMLVMGSQSGSVKNFPKWEENLKLAVRLQQQIEKTYPTLARPLSLMPKNYNESLTTGSMLLEFGTDANTLNEALYSAELVGDCLVKLLNNLS
ncbi:MAG: stage II sporulation protein P [Acutalibacteraceae bacterium]|jgi:stage II sporulation protein P